ncbi:MAG: hypothetical protein QOI89_2494 [Solirubrobacteraceae bacterium]|jgi:hypothetical protein|nr:hypothetical protein [Solirubrobacteraceae bacterium]
MAADEDFDPEMVFRQLASLPREAQEGALEEMPDELADVVRGELRRRAAARRLDVIGLQLERMTSPFPGAKARRAALGWWRSRRIARRMIATFKVLQGDLSRGTLTDAQLDHGLSALERALRDAGVAPTDREGA